MIDESGLSRNDAIELIKNKLYFSSMDAPDHVRPHSPWIPFTNDPSLMYTAFFADFGPLDLGLTVKFCQQLHETLTTAQEQKKAVIYFAGSGAQQRANSAVLILAYLIFVLNYSVEQAYGPFIGIEPPFITFRDAGFCINTFPITVLDSAKAMRKARILNHFNYKTFSIQNYQNLAKLQNGDISWIVPGKFIAFSGPVTKRRQISPGVYTLSPEQYVPIFKNLGVTCVVRFNDKCYDRRVFLNNGIKHVDLFYEDGGNPTEGILQSFLQVCEQETGAIAVHCKAGLGRTGTNIAAYMIKHYGYTAREATAWCRICRPGSIVGPQQQFLVSVEKKLLHEGNLYREKMKPSGMNGMRSGYSSSNGTTVSTLASESGDFSMRSNTPSILPNSNQKQNESIFKSKPVSNGIASMGGKGGNENDSFTNIVAKTLKEEAGRSQSTGPRGRENSLPISGSNSANNANTNNNSNMINEMKSSSKNGNDSSHSPLSLAVLPMKSSNYSPPDRANTPTADQRLRSRTGSFSRESSSSKQQQQQNNGTASDGNSRPRGVSLDISSATIGRSQSAARAGGGHNHSNDQPQPNNMKDIWIDPDIQHNLQIQGNTSSSSAKHHHHQQQGQQQQQQFGSNHSDIENSMPGLLRKNSKQAWNDKDLLSQSTSSKLALSATGNNNSNRFSMENSPYLLNGQASSVKKPSTNSSSLMPSIDKSRPQSSTGLSKSHDFAVSNNRNRPLASRYM